MGPTITTTPVNVFARIALLAARFPGGIDTSQKRNNSNNNNNSDTNNNNHNDMTTMTPTTISTATTTTTSINTSLCDTRIQEAAALVQSSFITYALGATP